MTCSVRHCSVRSHLCSRASAPQWLSAIPLQLCSAAGDTAQLTPLTQTRHLLSPRLYRSGLLLPPSTSASAVMFAQAATPAEASTHTTPCPCVHATSSFCASRCTVRVCRARALTATTRSFLLVAAAPLPPLRRPLAATPLCFHSSSVRLSPVTMLRSVPRPVSLCEGW
jgi:hypothetical protein